MKTLRLYDGYQNTSPSLRDDVKKLQDLLGLHGDGFFGPTTEKAVIAFQKKNRLEADGIVGPRTWAKLLGEEGPKKKQFATPYEQRHQRLLRQLKVVREEYFSFIEETATKAGMPPSVICGIGSRESEWGLSTALDKPGPGGKGDHGHGRGLMQIDDRYHEFARTGKWDNARENLLYAAQVLISSRKYLANRFTLDDKTLLRATLAAYNCGQGNVSKALKKGRDIDYYTAGRNYGENVLERAGWFQLHGIE